MLKRRLLGVMICVLLCVVSAYADQQRGQVLSNHFPVPGATVTLTQGKVQFSTVTNHDGWYVFPNLAPGAWSIHISLPLFAPVDAQVTVGPGSQPLQWNLKVLSLDDIRKLISGGAAGASVPAVKTLAKQGASVQQGLVVNGSVDNAATSKYSTNPAFGNVRKNSTNIYDGDFGFTEGNSALNARPYSLTGVTAPQQQYNDVTAHIDIGGPLNIPHLWRNGPDFFAQYQWSRANTVMDQAGLMPTLAQREGLVANPSPVATSLLALYPLPNVDGNSEYNYQIPVVNGSDTDAPQLRISREIDSKGDVLSGLFALERTRESNTNLFGFHDRTATLGINAGVTYSRYFASGMSLNISDNFSRSRMQVTPYFENRINIAGNAGMTGVAQDPRDWGPPTLVFSSGIASLTDAQSAFNRNETNSVSGKVEWNFGPHDIILGGETGREEFNYLSQSDPRGTFTFTGAAYGSDFADFLHGVPDTAAIVYGNADKYLRESVETLYANDNWQIAPGFTVNYGIRWEYSAPVTELKNRLANLDVSPGYSSAETVTAQSPSGPVTGAHYPRSLVRPDRSMIEPRLGIAWRPLAGSSLLLRAGYGIYADTSVYQGIALALAQQAPFSISISANNNTCPQSLATGPTACAVNTADTFGIDPNFRVGYAQVWQLSLQRDLPAAMQVIATYQGIEGSNGVQEFLPNTYPPGASSACLACATGFVYEISDGSSNRQSGSIELRHRLSYGFSASVLYTYSKSIDDDSMLGGQGPLAAGSASASAGATVLAQNWRDLKAERSRSSFDQRHHVSATIQYTTGMGLGGGALMQGWLGRIYKQWTVIDTLTAGTGLPETPVYLAAVGDTGFSGSLRPDRTAAPLYITSDGRYLNPAAFTAPKAGDWGNAGRYSITGPGQFTDNASLDRIFSFTQRYSVDARVDATNLLNHVVYTSYNTTINSSLDSPVFGLPASTGNMRGLQFSLRMRF